MENETYTLTRFYHEVKTLLEKYHLSNKKEYELSVSFDIEEKIGVSNPTLKCRISYHHSRYTDNIVSYFTSDCTPARALNDFEVKLKETTNHPIIDQVAIEIPAEAGTS